MLTTAGAARSTASAYEFTGRGRISGTVETGAGFGAFAGVSGAGAGCGAGCGRGRAPRNELRPRYHGDECGGESDDGGERR